MDNKTLALDLKLLPLKPNHDGDKKLSEREFIVIRDFIKERTGIFIRDGRSDYLRYRLSDRMLANNISTFEEYYHFLKYTNPPISGEFQELINLITVQETSFFRNSDQLDSLRDVLLPEVVKKKRSSGNGVIRIWCAACSTGEEPLTAAMIVKEFLKLHSDDIRVEIIATDVSTAAIEQAKAGLYAASRIEAVAEDLVDRYFTPTPDGFIAGAALTDSIRYIHLNLVSELQIMTIPDLKEFDFIFCRNVFIYFTTDVQLKIAKSLYKTLNPGGYILLGNAESIDTRKVPLKMTFFPGGMVYQKK